MNHELLSKQLFPQFFAMSKNVEDNNAVTDKYDCTADLIFKQNLAVFAILCGNMSSY